MELLDGLTLNINIPVLLLLPGSDLIVNPISTRNFFAKFPEKTVKVINYPECNHEIFHEINRSDIFADMKSFLISTETI